MAKCEKCGQEVKENKITFQKVSDTMFNVLLDGQKVGDIWSELSSGSKSTNGEGTIQVCGFQKVSPVWGCGRFSKSKDKCIDFKISKDN